LPTALEAKANLAVGIGSNETQELFEGKKASLQL